MPWVIVWAIAGVAASAFATAEIVKAVTDDPDIPNDPPPPSQLPLILALAVVGLVAVAQARAR